MFRLSRKRLFSSGFMFVVLRIQFRSLVKYKSPKEEKINHKLYYLFLNNYLCRYIEQQQKNLLYLYMIVRIKSIVENLLLESYHD
jgi:hypothetical protein